jgi:hypothetical protein
LAEQIAVQIIHLHANDNSDVSPVAPDAAVSNNGEDFPCVRIENAILDKEQVFAKFKTLLRKAGARTYEVPAAKSSPAIPPPNAPHPSRTQDTGRPKSRTP